MSLNPSKNNDPTAENQATIEGAILSATQTRWVKIAIGIMTALLAIGIPVLIGRVIYLARYGTNPSVTSAQPATEPSLAATSRLALPAGAQIKTLTLSGARLAVHHSTEADAKKF